MKRSGDCEYLSMVCPFLKFLKGMRMLRQLEDGNHVCSIYEMTLSVTRVGTAWHLKSSTRYGTNSIRAAADIRCRSRALVGVNAVNSD